MLNRLDFSKLKPSISKETALTSKIIAFQQTRKSNCIFLKALQVKWQFILPLNMWRFVYLPQRLPAFTVIYSLEPNTDASIQLNCVDKYWDSNSLSGVGKSQCPWSHSHRSGSHNRSGILAPPFCSGDVLCRCHCCASTQNWNFRFLEPGWLSGHLAFGK